VTISGPGSAALKISGDNRSQILLIDGAGKLNLSGLSLADGRAEAYLTRRGDSEPRYAAHLRLRLLEQSCLRWVWRRYLQRGHLTISRRTFTGNHVTGGGSTGSGPSGALGGGGGGFGGAIYVRQGKLALTDSTFDGNFAVGGHGDTAFSAGGPNYYAAGLAAARRRCPAAGRLLPQDSGSPRRIWVWRRRRGIG
jgi:hypothetical protein